MNKLKKLAAEFKAFITRGNVVDMAVAVIIGAAFGAIVTALTNGIIMPLVKWATDGVTGGAGIITMLKPVYTTAQNADGLPVQVLDMAKSIYIDWGTFLFKIIDFLIIALVLFVIIKVFMGLKKAAAGINDAAKKRTEKLVKKMKKQGMSEEEAQAAAAAQVAEAPAEPPAPVAPTTEELLIQIRDLLAKQNGVSEESQEPENKE